MISSEKPFHPSNKVPKNEKEEEKQQQQHK